MPLLRTLVLKDTTLEDTIKEISDQLFASLFYFKLTALPTLVDSRLRIEGQILCTQKAEDKALPLICQQLHNSILFINKKATRSKPTHNTYGNIVLPVVFLASNSFSLDIKQRPNSLPFPLSSSPYNSSVLISRGGLNASFSTRSHKRTRTDQNLPDRPSQKRKLF